MKKNMVHQHLTPQTRLYRNEVSDPAPVTRTVLDAASWYIYIKRNERQVMGGEPYGPPYLLYPQSMYGPGTVQDCMQAAESLARTWFSRRDYQGLVLAFGINADQRIKIEPYQASDDLLLDLGVPALSVVGLRDQEGGPITLLPERPR